MVFETIAVGPLGVNCYVIGCEKTRWGAVIDPGDDAQLILDSIKRHQVNVQYILLTHGHVDHLAHLSKIRQETGAAFLMHRDDTFLMKGLLAQALMFGLPNPGNPKPDRFVSDGEEIDLGDLTIRVLHTPGHSPGSVTYFVDKKLFVGDLIFAGSIGRTDLPGGDYETLIRSVQDKIFSLDPKIEIYPGHGPATTVGHESRTNPFFTSR
ncbi:MAG: MBL fold metallo-hydrolase [candidate division KSB1 bacterium]|nr:MBL fold metallo-hydrolase [candidate division KSB1 bacterium]MDZ7319231.1 MBL fold metallo-hydrolase [candidate division KSB1 bacterium]MDZ7341086.1 MBL fold metallo-hydrolase [candidate division KSB1 bacterium]